MKKSIVIALVLAASVVAALVAQTKINPTDPQPTCNMCPGYYIPVSELQAYTKKAIAERLTDQQVRDIEIGKAHIGIGMVHRGKLDGPAPNSVAEHDQVSEVYHIIEGTATLMLGADITNRQRRPATQQTVREFNGPGNNGSEIRNGVCVQPEGWRCRGDSGRHGTPVHEDRRSHRLSDGAHRSRQGDAHQGRGCLEGVSLEAFAGGAGHSVVDTAAAEIRRKGNHEGTKTRRRNLNKGFLRAFVSSWCQTVSDLDLLAFIALDRARIDHFGGDEILDGEPKRLEDRDLAR